MIAERVTVKWFICTPTATLEILSLHIRGFEHLITNGLHIKAHLASGQCTFIFL